MKKLVALIILVVFTNCNFETPTKFSKEVLQNRIHSITNESLTFKEVLEKYKGKKILIDVWASWCADCIKGLPKIKSLQKEYPEIVFLFLSVDTKKNAWKKGIERFRIIGEHYFVEGDFDSEFANFLNLSWIPRYVVVGETGSIILFKATKATDETIVEALKN